MKIGLTSKAWAEIREALGGTNAYVGNHPATAMIRFHAPFNFIEVDRGFMKSALDSLETSLVRAVNGLDELQPHECLLVRLLSGCAGVDLAKSYKETKENKEKG